MPPAARISDMHVCPKVEPGPVPHVGGPTSSGEKTVIIGGMPAARVGDSLVCFGGPPDSISQGESTVIIGGKPAARLGDSTSHGGVLVAGCPTVLIGSSAQAQTVILAARNRKPFCEECEKKKAEDEGSGAQAGTGGGAGGSSSAPPSTSANKASNSANAQKPPRTSQAPDCDHSWQKIESKPIAKTMKDNAERASTMQNSPSMASNARGYLFENKAIEANMKKLDIQETEAIYKCTKCPAKQEGRHRRQEPDCRIQEPQCKGRQEEQASSQQAEGHPDQAVRFLQEATRQARRISIRHERLGGHLPPARL